MSNKPVLCPWCGGEMIPPFEVPICCARPRAYHCDDCGAIAPTPLLPENMSGSNVRKAAYAAAQHRYEPPAKPLTWDELASRKGDAIYLEDFGEAKYFVALLPQITLEYACFRDTLRFFYAEKNDMNTRWRAWSRKPTEEERSAAKWEG